MPSLRAPLQAAAAGRIANGVVNGGYESTRFKTKPTPSPLASVSLLLGGTNNAEVEAAVARGLILGRAALLTRWGPCNELLTG